MALVQVEQTLAEPDGTDVLFAIDGRTYLIRHAANGLPATLWLDKAMASPAPNPISVNSGELLFWIEEGTYERVDQTTGAVHEFTAVGRGFQMIPVTQRGVPHGIATLDELGHIPGSQLPSSPLTYRGVWNATTNSPALTDAGGTAGHSYRVTVAGNRDLGSGVIAFVVGDLVVHNGLRWERSASADINDARLTAVERAQMVNVTSAPFNAAVDGVTDDTAAINLAWATAQTMGFKSVLIPGYAYVAGRLEPKSGVSLRGDNADTSGLIFDDASALAGIYYFGAPGGAPADRLLTADLVEGEDTITVANATNCGIVAGSVVMISAASVINGAWTTRVASVAGNVVTLEERAPISLSVAAHAPSANRFASSLKNVTISDLSLRTDSTGATTRKLLIDLWYVQNVTVERCAFSDLSSPSAAAIQLSNGLDCTVRNNRLDRILSAGSTFVSLPINITNVTGMVATGNTTRNSSSAISFSGCPRSVLSMNRCYGNRVPAGRAVKLYMSPYSSCVGNVLDNFGATTHGIRCTDSKGVAIADNAISNVGNGIFCGDGERPGVSESCTIVGNTLTDIAELGIYLYSNPAANHYHVVKGNNIRNTGRSGTAGMMGIWVASKRNLIEGNMVRGWGANASNYGINVAFGENVVRSNVGENGGLGRFISHAGSGNRVYGNVPLGGETIVPFGDGLHYDVEQPRDSAVVKVADYTPVASDAGKLIEMALPANGTLTIPDNATVPYPIGTRIRVTKMSTGNVAIAGAAGVTTISRGNLVTLAALYGEITLRKRGTNQWHLTGDLA